jgi:hypothetical protein
LSSVETWLGGAACTESVMKAYWFTRTFSNCSAMSKMLMEALHVLTQGRKPIQLSFGSVSLDANTARIEGLSVLKKDNRSFYNLYNSSEAGAQSNEAHRPGESHNHVVVVLKETGSDTEYVLDLTGTQFGFFGFDPLRPQIVCEPYSVYIQRFKHAEIAVPRYPDEGKIQIYEKHVSLLFTLWRQMCRGSSSGASNMGNVSNPVSFSAEAAALEAERSLLALLDLEDQGNNSAAGHGTGKKKKSKKKKGKK